MFFIIALLLNSLCFYTSLYAQEIIHAPLYGDIMVAQKKEGLVQALPEKQLGVVTINQASVQKASDQPAAVTATVSFLGLKFHAELKENSFVLSNFDKKPLHLVGVNFESLSLETDGTGEVVIIKGVTTFFGLKLVIQLTSNENATSNKIATDVYSSNRDASFSVSAYVMPGVNEWFPFKGSGIAELEALRLYDLKVGLEAGFFQAAEVENKSSTGLFGNLFIEGSTTILNVNSTAKIMLNNKQNKGRGLIGFFGLPNGWKFSQSFPELFAEKNPVTEAFDLLKIDDAAIMLSTTDGEISAGGRDYFVEKGLNFKGSLALENTYSNQILTLINDVIKEIIKDSPVNALQAGSEKVSLLLQGVIPPSPKNIAFKVALSSGDFGFNLGPLPLYGGQLFFILQGEPSIGFGGSFKTRPTPQDEVLETFINIGFSPHKVGLSGSIKGMWKDPFGIKGFEFGNLGLRGSQTYTVLAEAAGAAAGTAGIGLLWLLVPADAGLTGDLKIGDGAQAIYASVRMNVGKDITSLGVIAEIKNPLMLPHLISALFKEAGVTIQFPDILPIKLEQAKIYFVPLGTSVGAIKLEQGIGFSTYLDILGKKAHVDAGIDWNRGVVAKGKLPALKIGELSFTGANGQGDPEIDFELGFANQIFKISGQLALGSLLKSNTDINLSTQGLTFKSETSVGPENGKIAVSIQGKTILFTDFETEIKPEDVGLSLEFKNDLTSLINQSVDRILLERKEIFQRDINNIIVQIARDATQHDLDEQQNRVTQAENNRVWFIENPGLSIEREAKVGEEKLKLAALQIKYGLDQIGVGEALRNVADTLGLTQAINDALAGIRSLGVGAFDAGRFVFNNIANLVDVKRIFWQGTAADIHNGIIPGVTLEIVLGGNHVTKNLGDFDLKNPLESVAKIGNALATLAFEDVKEKVTRVT